MSSGPTVLPRVGLGVFARSDKGVSLTELAIVTMLIGFVMATVGGLIAGLLDDWRRQSEMTAIQRDTRPVIQQLLIGLRESEPADPSPTSHPVVALDWDHVHFVSDVLSSDDVPELVQFQLADCSSGTSGGECELRIMITEADDPLTAPFFTFSGTPLRDEVVLTSVLATPATPLFLGVVRDPDRIDVSTCVAAACDLDVVEVSLAQRLASIPDGETVLLEAVRLRNVPRR